MARARTVLAAGLAALLTLSCGAFKRFAYEGFGRDDWQQPERVIQALAIAPGDRVADLGAGGGYFTFLLADAVGESGRVWAVDVDQAMTSHLESRAAEAGYHNIEVVLAEPADPALPDGAIDLVLCVDTYHHLDDRVAYFSRLRTDLSPRGRVAILEFNDSRRLIRWMGHYTPRQALLDEMQRAGYRLVAEHDFVDRQTFAVFAPADAGATPR